MGVKSEKSQGDVQEQFENYAEKLSREQKQELGEEALKVEDVIQLGTADQNRFMPPAVIEEDKFMAPAVIEPEAAVEPEEVVEQIKKMNL